MKSIMKKLENRLILEEVSLKNISQFILNLLLSPSYRIPRKVSEIHVFWNDDAYALCPHCNQCLDRDFQAFCDCCGQCLDWSVIEKAKIVYIERNGARNETKAHRNH